MDFLYLIREPEPASRSTHAPTRPIIESAISVNIWSLYIHLSCYLYLNKIRSSCRWALLSSEVVCDHRRFEEPNSAIPLTKRQGFSRGRNIWYGTIALQLIPWYIPVGPNDVLARSSSGQKLRAQGHLFAIAQISADPRGRCFRNRLVLGRLRPW